MKNILSITCLAVIMLCSNAYSQSNLTWTLKDKVEKGFFKSHKSLNTNFSGFNSKEEATKFLAKIKSYPEIASAEVVNIDANGNGDVKLVMKEVHDKLYYVGLAQKLGVAYVQYNGQKKTPAQAIQEIRNKNK